MIEPSLASTSRGVPRPSPPIEFYSIEIMPLAGGGMSVGMSATICETIHDHDFELVRMDVASARVDSIDEALAVIRDAVTLTMTN